MMDGSAFGVQLAPIVIQDMFPSIPALVKGEWSEVFSGWQIIRRVFMDGFWNSVYSDIKNIDLSTRLKSAKGEWANKIFREIVSSPNYALMKQSGLQISETQSLTDSEEFYRSDLINKVPLFGFTKDLSENTMVATLNLYRAHMFDRFYNMYGPMSLNEWKRVSEHINNMTGTTNKAPRIMSALSYGLSAPKLALSRLRLVWALSTIVGS